nr:hypothetical protein [Elizabethkingia sp. ASV34]
MSRTVSNYQQGCDLFPIAFSNDYFSKGILTFTSFLLNYANLSQGFIDVAFCS